MESVTQSSVPATHEGGVGFASVPALVAAQAGRTPDRVAIEWDSGPAWTYADLMHRSMVIAVALAARGAGRGSLVGVAVRRRPELVATILAVQRVGAAYVALDPEFPPERLCYMANHAGIQQIVAWQARDVAADVSVGCEVLALDGMDLDGGVPAVFPGPGADDLAYVLYTSGSTGKPKGVGVLQRNLVNFLTSMARAPGLSADDVLCAVTTLSFDIAGLELYLPLITGARIVIATEREQLDPRRFAQLLQAHRVTVLQTTPTLLRLLVGAAFAHELHGLRLLVGGEALPRDLADMALLHCRELWNMYGPTETTVWSTIHPVVRADGDVPLGKPIANTSIYVLDDSRQQVADGVVGEIWIGGAGVADGYLHDPRKTAERFVADPFTNDGSNMYRTGDLGVLHDGVLHFKGRADDQIKLRGYRIEPGDIEAVARSVDGVEDAVAVARELAPGDRRLILYVTGPDDAALADAVLARLRNQLPAYMVPQHVERLDGLPHTPNGKIDRKALPLPAALAAPGAAGATTLVGVAQSAEDGKPLGRLEFALLEIWRELLKVSRLGIDDNFFAMGGDSLLAVRVFERMQKLTGVNLPLATLLTAPTVARQAAAFRAAGAKDPGVKVPPFSAGAVGNDPWTPVVPIQPGGSRPPLFCMHAVGGNVLNYVPLAHGLGPDQPFYGVQAIGLDGVTPPSDSVQEMAVRYAASIRKVQPHGPYFLAGGSMGGIIAYAVAQRLRAAGEPIALLAMFDTYAPGYGASARESRPVSVTRILAAVAWRARRLTDVLQVKWARIHHRALSHALRYRVIEHIHDGAERTYVPPPYPGAIVLFRALDGPSRAGKGSDQMGWEGTVTGGIEVIHVPGAHEELIEQPELLVALRTVLEHAQAQTKSAI